MSNEIKHSVCPVENAGGLESFPKKNLSKSFENSTPIYSRWYDHIRSGLLGPGFLV
jgi:hypothetical protein